MIGYLYFQLLNCVRRLLLNLRFHHYLVVSLHIYHLIFLFILTEVELHLHIPFFPLFKLLSLLSLLSSLNFNLFSLRDIHDLQLNIRPCLSVYYLFNSCFLLFLQFFNLFIQALVKILQFLKVIQRLWWSAVWSDAFFVQLLLADFFSDLFVLQQGVHFFLSDGLLVVIFEVFCVHRSINFALRHDVRPNASLDLFPAILLLIDYLLVALVVLSPSLGRLSSLDCALLPLDLLVVLVL